MNKKKGSILSIVFVIASVAILISGTFFGCKDKEEKPDYKSMLTDTALYIENIEQENLKLVEKIKALEITEDKSVKEEETQYDEERIKLLLSMNKSMAKATSVEQGTQGTDELQAKLAKAEAAVMDLQEKLANAETAADQSKILREYESVRAQVIGLEKIIEEKNATIEETSKEQDHWKVNMDVLLSRITEQQDGLQELKNENRELVKELAAKNQELADLNEQLIQTPVQR